MHTMLNHPAQQHWSQQPQRARDPPMPLTQNSDSKPADAHIDLNNLAHIIATEML